MARSRTLCKGLLNITTDASEGVLRRVHVGWRGTYSAGGRWARSRRGGMRGTSCLCLKDKFKNVLRVVVDTNLPSFQLVADFLRDRMLEDRIQIYRGWTYRLPLFLILQGHKMGSRKQVRREIMQKKRSDSVRARKGWNFYRGQSKKESQACYCWNTKREVSNRRETSSVPLNTRRVTLSSFISPSSCTISSLRLSCRDDILCSSSSFLCLQHRGASITVTSQRDEAGVKNKHN